MKTKPTRHWILNRDIKGDWTIPKETCSKCVHGLSCQTSGYPGSGALANLWKGSMRLQAHGIRSETHAAEFLNMCERPLGIARRGNVKPVCKHQYLWFSKYVPLRTKAGLAVEVSDSAWEIMLGIAEKEKKGGLATPRLEMLKKSVKLIRRLAELFDRQQISLDVRQSANFMISTLETDYRNVESAASASNPVPIITTILHAVTALQKLNTCAVFAGGDHNDKQIDHYNTFVRDAYWASDKLAEIQSHRSIGYEDGGSECKMTEKDWGIVHEVYLEKIREQVKKLIELAK